MPSLEIQPTCITIFPPDDRGRSKYFHGRSEIRSRFLRRLNHYNAINGGSIFLVTGPPGAGKSALLYMLGEDAEDLGWNVKMDITPEHFTSPLLMAKCLSVKLKHTTTRSTSIDAKVLQQSWGTSRILGAAIADVMRTAASARPLLLVLDEAQELSTIADILEDRKVASAAMGLLHNGKLGYPVVLLAGGLDTSREVLSAFGMSRITNENRARIGALSMESTREVIRAYVLGETGIDIPEQWVEPIAKKTQGWPQHIVCYSGGAATKVSTLQHAPSDSDLKDIVTYGRSSQVSYYEERTHDFDWEALRCIAGVFETITVGGSTTRSVIENALKEVYTQEQTKDIFTRALRQGVITGTAYGKYTIPIPSMHSWLTSEFGPSRI